MFTKEEESKIGLIITLCKDNDTLRKNLEDKYNNNPSLLSPYEIYVLEVVYRYGNNGYYEGLLKCGSNIQSIEIAYKTFMNSCKEIPNFELKKVKDYYNNPSNLNELEKLCIKLILKNQEKKRILENKMMYTYDDYVEIKLDSDCHIREAIMHIFFIKAFAALLENRIDKDSYNEIIKRQIKPGMFASCDKYFLSNMLREIPEIGQEIIKSTDKCFEDIKNDVENGNGLSLLSNQLGEGIEGVKINISFADVYGNLIKNNTNSKSK